MSNSILKMSQRQSLTSKRRGNPYRVSKTFHHNKSNETSHDHLDKTYLERLETIVIRKDVLNGEVEARGKRRKRPLESREPAANADSKSCHHEIGQSKSNDHDHATGLTNSEDDKEVIDEEAPESDGNVRKKARIERVRQRLRNNKWEMLANLSNMSSSSESESETESMTIREEDLEVSLAEIDISIESEMSEEEVVLDEDHDDDEWPLVTADNTRTNSVFGRKMQDRIDDWEISYSKARRTSTNKIDFRNEVEISRIIEDVMEEDGDADDENESIIMSSKPYIKKEGVCALVEEEDRRRLELLRENMQQEAAAESVDCEKPKEFDNTSHRVEDKMKVTPTSDRMIVRRRASEQDTFSRKCTVCDAEFKDTVSLLMHKSSHRYEEKPGSGANKTKNKGFNPVATSTQKGLGGPSSQLSETTVEAMSGMEETFFETEGGNTTGKSDIFAETFSQPAREGKKNSETEEKAELRFKPMNNKKLGLAEQLELMEREKAERKKRAEGLSRACRNKQEAKLKLQQKAGGQSPSTAATKGGIMKAKEKVMKTPAKKANGKERYSQEAYKLALEKLKKDEEEKKRKERLEKKEQRETGRKAVPKLNTSKTPAKSKPKSPVERKTTNVEPAVKTTSQKQAQRVGKEGLLRNRIPKLPTLARQQSKAKKGKTDDMDDTKYETSQADETVGQFSQQEQANATLTEQSESNIAEYSDSEEKMMLDQVEGLEEKVSSLQEELRRANEELGRLNSNKGDLEMRCSDYKKACQEALQEKNELMLKYQGLSSQLNTSQDGQALLELSELRSLNEEISGKLTEMTGQRDYYKGRNDHSEKELDEARKVQEQLEQAQEGLKQELYRSQSEMREVQRELLVREDLLARAMPGVPKEARLERLRDIELVVRDQLDRIAHLEKMEVQYLAKQAQDKETVDSLLATNKETASIMSVLRQDLEDQKKLAVRLEKLVPCENKNCPYTDAQCARSHVHTYGKSRSSKNNGVRPCQFYWVNLDGNGCTKKEDCTFSHVKPVDPELLKQYNEEIDNLKLVMYKKALKTASKSNEKKQRPRSASRERKGKKYHGRKRVTLGDFLCLGQANGNESSGICAANASGMSSNDSSTASASNTSRDEAGRFDAGSSGIAGISGIQANTYASVVSQNLVSSSPKLPKRKREEMEGQMQQGQGESHEWRLLIYDYFDCSAGSSTLDGLINRYKAGNVNGESTQVAATPLALSNGSKMHAMSREYATDTYQQRLGMISPAASPILNMGPPQQVGIPQAAGGAPRQNPAGSQRQDQDQSLLEKIGGLFDKFQDKFDKKLQLQENKFNAQLQAHKSPGNGMDQSL